MERPPVAARFVGGGGAGRRLSLIAMEPRLSIAEAGRSFRDGAVSPLELAQALPDRIASMDGALGSIAAMLGDMALAEAVRATRELAEGRDRGPLHGIPF